MGTLHHSRPVKQYGLTACGTTCVLESQSGLAFRILQICAQLHVARFRTRILHVHLKTYFGFVFGSRHRPEVSSPLAHRRIRIKRNVHLVLLVQVDGADDTSHGLTEAFVGPETGPSEKRALGIGHPYRNLVLFSITQIRRNVHYERQCTPHMGHSFRLLHLCIASYRSSVHIHRCPYVHSLKLQEEHLPTVFFVYGYFLTIPRFSTPTTLSRTGIQISVLLIITMRNPYRLPSGIVERKRSHGPGLFIILPCFRVHFHFTQRYRHILSLFCLAFQSGKTHITCRPLNFQIQISSRHRLGIPHRSGMPHGRKVALFMEHTEFLSFRKGLPSTTVGGYFQLDLCKPRPVRVEPQFHRR